MCVIYSCHIKKKKKRKKEKRKKEKREQQVFPYPNHFVKDYNPIIIKTPIRNKWGT
jgi:hypothetical protein